jgi:hypothetical protein
MKPHGGQTVTTVETADTVDTVVRQVEEDGFAVLPGVLAPGQADTVAGELAAALAQAGPEEEGPLRSQAGALYAARNVLALWPAAVTVWCVPPLLQVLCDLLGPQFGLVRVLFFDKPPGQTWALGWHKDLTVAVRDNRLPNHGHFCRPTRKAGVDHVEAPEEILQAMVTVRLHLDDVTEENGPLKVIPGSHRDGKRLVLGAVPPCTVLVERGGVLLMRPLLAHSSGRSHPETSRHRRILHLEFSGRSELPDGYAWHTFLPAAAVTH